MSDRAETISRFISLYRLRRGVEVGVLNGDTFFKLLDRHPDLYMVGIDMWLPIISPVKQDRETGEASYADHDMEAYYRDVSARALRYPRRCGILRCSSLEAAAEFPDNQFDFCFIDADHRTQAVVDDVTAWSRCVRKRGLIMGHDANWPSVQLALHKLGLRFNVANGNVWWTFKL